jgi:hypothetical protein
MPYEAHFRDANAKTAAQNLWKGPWDKSLRCDALDSLRFIPTCCDRSFVPFMGMSTFYFSCDHRKTKSNGDYLSLMRNYTHSTLQNTVCDELVVLGPKVNFSPDSMPVLALLCSKNNVKMNYQITPFGNSFTMPKEANYTALEVSLVDSLEQFLGVVDTLEITNGFSWQAADPFHLNHLNYRGIVRSKLRFLGDGNIGIDEVKLYFSPKVYSRIIPSCSGKDGRIVIDSVRGLVAPLLYSWSTGSTLSYIDSLNPGTYSLILEDAKGNRAKRIFRVNTRFSVTVDSLKFIDTSGIAGYAILGYVGGKPTKWSWTSPLGFSDTTEKPALFKPAIYTVKITDSAGCYNTTQIAMGIRCDQIVSPPTWSDSICAGTVPMYNPAAPFSSLSARYWTASNNADIAVAMKGAKVWQGFTQGWNTRFVRWVDTINGCIGNANPVSVYVGVPPTAPTAANWLECATNFGFTHSWPPTQLSRKLYWRSIEQSTWTNIAQPHLSPMETNAATGNYKWVGKYKDTVTGCFSDTIVSNYRVMSQIQANLRGTRGYIYGTTSTLEAKGLPAGSSKSWSISYGAQFEMNGPGGSMHPCHGQTQCVSTDSVLIVRHSTIPCWTPPRVISSVQLITTTGICVSQSNLTDYDTGYYDCFGTQLLPGDTSSAVIEGETLVLRVPTSSGYHQIDDPLHMDYGNCNFYLPYEWQIQNKDSVKWLPLSNVLDAVEFSTKTDTNMIKLVIPSISCKLNEYKIRLMVQRCKGIWTESKPQRLVVSKDTNDYRIYPNPTADKVVVHPYTQSQIKIYNSFGDVVFSGSAAEIINTKEWDNGVYWVKLAEQKVNKTIGKLVVLH